MELQWEKKVQNYWCIRDQKYTRRQLHFYHWPIVFEAIVFYAKRDKT